MKKTGNEQSEKQNTILTVNKIEDDTHTGGKDSYKKQTSMLETVRYSISLTKDTDNKPADGKSLNQATAILRCNDAPCAGQIVFTLTGSAYFDDGSQKKTSETNSDDGKATVNFYDKKPEGETVKLSVAHPNDITPDATDRKSFSFTPFVDPNSILIFENVPNSMTTDDSYYHISVSVIDKDYLPCTIHVKTSSDKLQVTPEYVTLNYPETVKKVQLYAPLYTVESWTNIGTHYHPNHNGTNATISASIVDNPSIEIHKEIKVNYVVDTH
ncbi:hypothetical protein [Photorhabdus viridis]|uniref:hypothetical protein n=1 Tax=Photorhabdus viridis TaxID=3163327 RepID=UPI0033077786